MTEFQLRREWLEKLSKYTINNGNNLFSKIEDSELLDLKDQIFNLENEGGEFFKYTSLSDFSIDNIEKDTIGLSDTNKFNDPYDSKGFQLQMNKNLTKESIDQLLKSEAKHLITPYLNRRKQRELYLIKTTSELSEFVRKINPKTRGNLFFENYDINRESLILGHESTLASCFSSSNNSILMWSHYAKQHEGFCIGYDYQKHKDYLYPINYQNHFFTDEMVMMAIDKAKISKAEEWGYEKEWRFVVTQQIQIYYLIKLINFQMLNAPQYI